MLNNPIIKIKPEMLITIYEMDGDFNKMKDETISSTFYSNCV